MMPWDWFFEVKKSHTFSEKKPVVNIDGRLHVDMARKNCYELKYLARDFSSCEIASVRGAIETLIRLSPLGRLKLMCAIGFMLDSLTGKLTSNQVSGYKVFLVK